VPTRSMVSAFGPSGEPGTLGARNALITNESPERLADRFAGFFDRVLLDAPCSGEGCTARAMRRAGSGRRAGAGCALRQSHILAQAARLVRPGGRLVYSTCTFAPEENEGVISQLLLTDPICPCGAGAGARVRFRRRTGRLQRRAGRPAPCSAPVAAHGPREGHFVAVLQRAAGSDECVTDRWQPERVSKPIHRLHRAFCEEILLSCPDAEDLAMAGAYLYAVPPSAPDLAGCDSSIRLVAGHRQERSLRAVPCAGVGAVADRGKTGPDRQPDIRGAGGPRLPAR